EVGADRPLEVVDEQVNLFVRAARRVPQCSRTLGLAREKRTRGDVCLFGVRWSSTKPRRLAGLRCLREIPLPEAHDEIALTLGRLLPPRVHLIGRVWDAGEESVANRLDELRRNANVRRLLVG